MVTEITLLHLHLARKFNNSISHLNMDLKMSGLALPSMAERCFNQGWEVVVILGLLLFLLQSKMLFFNATPITE